MTTRGFSADRCSVAQLASAGLSIMALPSQAAASGFGELIPHQQPGMPKNCVYHRMEQSDPSRRYRNKMRLTLREGSALLEREGQQPVTLHLDWMDNETLIIDWSSANERWGRNQLRVGSVDGAAGFIKEEPLACHPSR